VKCRRLVRFARLLRLARLLPLCALVLCGVFSCKSAPRLDISEDETPVYGDEDFGGYDYEDWDLGDDDEEPFLALPPGVPPDGWSGELIEPLLEGGEAFLPDFPPEEAALVLAEPLPEPEPPDLPEPEAGPETPVLTEEPSGEELPQEELLAEDPATPASPESPPEESPAEEPPPAPPPPPPRIVRPSEPIPPPPPAREIIPMPPVPLPDLPARNPPVLTPAPEPAPSSRVVRALAGQTVEVPFRGTGWVYLGESASKRGLDYVSRRLDSEGQTFVFRAAEAGLYELKFYRQDFIRDYIINDLVTVIVEEPPVERSAPPRPGAAVDRGVTIAEPRWPVVPGRAAPEAGAAPPQTPGGSGAAAPAAGSQAVVPSAGSGPAAAVPPPGSGAVGAAAPETAVSETAVPGGQGAAAEPSPLLPRETTAEAYLRRAREEYQEGRFPQARAVLDQFLEYFPLGSDEAYWLYAQLCEKQGPSRDIRLALDYYRRLVAEYPQSGRYNDARRRIAYLERYYINIQ
jgi:tetratricopeptide (TPR) repeat protein